MGRKDFSLTEYNSEPQQTWNFVKTLWNKLYFAQKSPYKINDIFQMKCHSSPKQIILLSARIEN